MLKTQKHLMPYALATIQRPQSKRRRIVQVISYPIGDGNIMVRLTPTDPTTLAEVAVGALMPLGYSGRYIQIGRVVGHGEFFPAKEIPEDMLRYEAAALMEPNDYEETVQEDRLGRVAGAPVWSDKYEPGKAYAGIVYKLTSLKKPNWVNDRWVTFGCKVEHVMTIDLRDKS